MNITKSATRRRLPLRASAASFSAMVVVIAACGGGSGSGSSNLPLTEVRLQSLSSPEKMTSGDDTLVQVAMADDSLVTGVSIRLNGADVTAKFQKASKGNASLGLLTGLNRGDNLIEVNDVGGEGKLRASLKLTAYPVQGPILYAPQEPSLHCQTDTFNIYPGGPTLTSGPNNDPNCAAPTRVDWVYHDATKAGSAVWQPYDPAKQPANVELTTLQDGTKVPYIVRLETGVINRGIYQLAVLGDPVKNPNPTPLNPPAGFNGKLVYPFGQSCGSGWYVQGRVMGPVGGSAASSNGTSGDNNALNDLPLSQGFAVANSTLNYFGQNCNHIISAETMMMVKERFIKANGPVLYTMGWGNSGSAMQQSMIADTYPGLLDGIVLLNGFPDNTSSASVEGRLFYNYQLNHTKNGTTQNGTYTPLPNNAYDPSYDNATASARLADPTLVTWTNSELAAASGYSTYHSIRQQASFWAGRTDSVLRPINAGDRDNVTGGSGNSSVFSAVIGTNEKYSPANVVAMAPMGKLPAPPVSTLPANPKGLRPNVSDHNKNMLGVEPTGFGRSYTANVGLQYGLNSLNTGQITMAQFIDLNKKIGGQDIDGNMSTERMQPDLEGLKNAYQTGMIMYGGAGLAQTAVLDLDNLNNEFSGAGDLHLKFYHYMIRARIAAATGSFDNHVMWNGVADIPAFKQDPNANHATPVQAPRPAITGRRLMGQQKAFAAMDQWLTALANDKSSMPLKTKVVKNKPATLVDGCFGATTPGAVDDFIAEPQVFGGFNTVFNKGNGSNSPAGTVGTVGVTPSRCNAMAPASSYPRFDAGEPITGRTMQCMLKAVNAKDYDGYATANPGWGGVQRTADLAALSAVFPTGVCDFTKPGMQEQPLAGTWIQITGLNQRKVGYPLAAIAP